LHIENGVWLGWDVAQKQGQGAILLQPRTAESVITVGANTQMSNNVTVMAMGKISIGAHCLIGDMTSIIDCDFHEIEPSKRGEGVGPVEPVIIGNNVWIGSRALILRGVAIGDNSVIGAGSVVTKSIPPNSLAVGIPARVVRKI
jgi:maltose O-acetyltransferase